MRPTLAARNTTVETSQLIAVPTTAAPFLHGAQALTQRIHLASASRGHLHGHRLTQAHVRALAPLLVAQARPQAAAPLQAAQAHPRAAAPLQVAQAHPRAAPALQVVAVAPVPPQLIAPEQHIPLEM